jgi:glucose-6-phosphate isomerase
VPAVEDWTPAAELRAQHFLPSARLKDLMPQLLHVRSQVAAERELREVPPEMQPLDAGFIDLPQKTLDQHRRQGEAGPLGRILAQAARLREQTDRLVVLGIGGSSLGARALFEALCHTHHNDLPPDKRLGAPRIYFAGDHADNDALHDLLDLLQTTCVDPELRDERWGAVVVSKSGDTLETATAYRVFRREAAEYYGSRSERLRQLFVPVTGESGKLRELCKADGYSAENILTIPDNVAGCYSVFTAAGLLPAAAVGLDVRALLLGAAAMTRRFLDEPFERNPVLQYAGVNYLMAEEFGKPARVLAIWSEKLAALGHWYDQLLADSLGKQGRGPTPVTVLQPGGLHAFGQQLQEGPRNKLINNLVRKAPRHPPIAIAMADRNQDDLNSLSRKTLPDILDAAWHGTNLALHAAARPSADLVLPTLSEHTLGQLMQMLMLATVVEGRLMGINPYGQPAVESYKGQLRELLKG